ncbi:MAG: PDZ domain-containing protein [Myxococcota bacterium]
MRYGTLLWWTILACSPRDVGCEVREAAGGDDDLPTGGAVAPEPMEPRADGETIEHTLRFSAPQTNYFEIETSFRTEGLTTGPDEDAAGGVGVDVMMAVWTPGSYLVREFAKHVRELRASTPEGEALRVFKTAKNRWRVVAEGGEVPERVVLRARIYAHEMSVRTNFVDDEFALLCGAGTFLVPVQGQERPHDVSIDMPEGWAESVTGLDPYPNEAHRYLARDFDELVDSPIALGNPSLHRWDEGGVPHVLATFGGADVWDDEKAARDVEAITRVQHEFWGVVPYQRYAYINLAMGGGGGLEHRTSTIMLTDRWASRDDDEYRRWLGLVSHEFFHTWNIKRLRPAVLGPFDFENENYTDDLWIVEGLTSYYDDLLLRRAGLLDDDQYFGRIAKGIARLQGTPGRRVQSLSASSFDAWIHFYRPDENSRNTGVSYYTKGALVGLLLDARIRDATGGSRSLDDAMRIAYARYSGDRGYESEDFKAICEELVEESLDDFWTAYIEGTEELGYDAALAVFGLRFASSDGSAEPFVGLSAGEGARIVVREVVDGSPAFDAGINVGDELIAFGDERLPESWTERVGRYESGDAVEVLVSRRGLLRRLTLTLGEAPRDDWTLEVDVNSSPGSRRQRDAWLQN